MDDGDGHGRSERDVRRVPTQERFRNRATLGFRPLETWELNAYILVLVGRSLCPIAPNLTNPVRSSAFPWYGGTARHLDVASRRYSILWPGFTQLELEKRTFLPMVPRKHILTSMVTASPAVRWAIQHHPGDHFMR